MQENVCIIDYWFLSELIVHNIALEVNFENKVKIWPFLCIPINLLEYTIPAAAACHKKNQDGNISKKRKELPEMRWWQNGQNFEEFSEFWI